ncbi:MAG: hypothetical protein ACHP7N_08090 [Caulobacterales bacterium]
MMDDPVVLDRQAAYIDTLRGLYKSERTAGFAACLIGVLMMLVGRFRGGAPIWLVWSGAGVVAIGWGLFLYAILKRLSWVRTHPFDPNG